MIEIFEKLVPGNIQTSIAKQNPKVLCFKTFCSDVAASPGITGVIEVSSREEERNHFTRKQMDFCLWHHIQPI